MRPAWDEALIVGRKGRDRALRATRWRTCSKRLFRSVSACAFASSVPCCARTKSARRGRGAAHEKHRRSQRRRWHTQLLESDTGVSRVLRSLRNRRKTMAPEVAEALSKHIDCFLRNRRRTAYASCRRENRPIGSGITESACKSLIGVRAKRSGQRWSQRGLSSALHLRAIHDSDRFDRFWPFFAARYRARHVVALGQHSVRQTRSWGCGSPSEAKIAESGRNRAKNIVDRHVEPKTSPEAAEAAREPRPRAAVRGVRGGARRGSA